MVVILLVAPSTTNGYHRIVNPNKSRDCKIRHVTRINISDVYSQIELGSERTSADPVTKEGKLHLIEP